MYYFFLLILSVIHVINGRFSILFVYKAILKMITPGLLESAMYPSSLAALGQTTFKVFNRYHD